MSENKHMYVIVDYKDKSLLGSYDWGVSCSNALYDFRESGLKGIDWHHLSDINCPQWVKDLQISGVNNEA